ncbi:MAG: hypothetical protein ACF8MJ_09325 [Phycisphaerales bacterium JB050]
MKTAITAAAVLALSGAAMADDLLLVDLTVPNQVTITATDGVSAIDATSSAFTGVYLADFYTAGTLPGLGSVAGTGDFTSVGSPSDGTPSIFNSAGNFGLNIWSFSGAASTFTAGQQAFQGSGTWAVDPDDYAQMVAGNLFGDLYANADTDDDLPANGVLGTWRVVIPSPGTAGLLGLAGFAAVRRRR